MTDDEMLSSFEACTLPGALFHHREHVRVAWLYLGRYPLLAAIERFVTSLKRYAISQGQHGLYHETITWAYLLLVNERMKVPQPALTWDDFARDNADLLTWRPSILDRYYHQQTLWSERARAMFLLPDLSCAAPERQAD